MFCKEICWGGCCFSEGIVTNPLEHTTAKLRRKLSHSRPYSISYIGVGQLPFLQNIRYNPAWHKRICCGKGTSWFLLLTWGYAKRKPGNKICVPSARLCDALTLLFPSLLAHLSMSIWRSLLFHCLLKDPLVTDTESPGAPQSRGTQDMFAISLCDLNWL